MLFPLSGYANRFQAMASSSILAESLGASLRICWEPQEVLPASAGEVFSTDFCNSYCITPEQALDEFGVTRSAVPRYLHRDDSRGLITLAGHDRGEQAFIPDLRDMLANASGARTLAIAAGGQFFLPNPDSQAASIRADFRDQRRRFYSTMLLREETEEAVRLAIADRCAFMGLHLRYSDRSHQAPLDRSIRRALRASTEASGLTSLFIASDTAAARDRWVIEAERLGLDPWYITHDSLARSQASGSHAALVDWRVLGHAQRLVYFAESSFAVEAAVAGSGFDDSVALPASAIRAAAVGVNRILESARTYPRRHGWRGPTGRA